MRINKTFRLRIGKSRLLAIKIQAWNKELHTHYGITNETPERLKKYIPFWDFQENTTQSEVESALREIQKEYCLSTIYILQTKPNPSYRAIAFDELDWQEYIAILASTSFIDLDYLRFTVMRGRAVIRISEKDGTKNTLVGWIHGYAIGRKVSAHHRTFFNALYPEIKPVFPMPKPIKVRLSKYESFR